MFPYDNKAHFSGFECIYFKQTSLIFEHNLRWGKFRRMNFSDAEVRMFMHVHAAVRQKNLHYL